MASIVGKGSFIVLAPSDVRYARNSSLTNLEYASVSVGSPTSGAYSSTLTKKNSSSEQTSAILAAYNASTFTLRLSPGIRVQCFMRHTTPTSYTSASVGFSIDESIWDATNSNASSSPARAALRARRDFSLPTSKEVVTDGRITLPRNATIGIAPTVFISVNLSESSSVSTVVLSIMVILYPFAVVLASV